MTTHLDSFPETIEDLEYELSLMPKSARDETDYEAMDRHDEWREYVGVALASLRYSIDNFPTPIPDLSLLSRIERMKELIESANRELGSVGDIVGPEGERHFSAVYWRIMAVLDEARIVLTCYEPILRKNLEAGHRLAPSAKRSTKGN